MLLNWIKNLFGTWEEIESFEDTLHYESILFGKKWTEKGYCIIEQNSLTGDKRAYAEKVDGTRERISVKYAERMVKRKKRFENAN